MEKEGGGLIITKEGLIIDLHDGKLYTLISLIMAYKKCSYEEALKWLETTFGVKLPNDTEERAKKQLEEDISKAINYLNSVLPARIIKLQKFMTEPVSYRIIFDNGLYINFATTRRLFNSSYARKMFTSLFGQVVQLTPKTWHNALGYLFKNAFEIRTGEKTTI
jgi:hypothetical protein